MMWATYPVKLCDWVTGKQTLNKLAKLNKLQF